MNRDELREKEKQNYFKTLKITKNIITENPDLKELEYSFNWAIFSHFNSNSQYLSKRENKSIFARISMPKKRYFIYFGDIDRKIIEKIESEGLVSFKIKLTRQKIGYVTENEIVFPQTYQKTKIIIKGDYDKSVKNEIEKITADNISDLNRFKKEVGRLFKKSKPAFVLLDEDRTKYKYALADIASEFNIKSFVIQHGITLKTNNSGVPFANESFAPLHGDYFLCWGRNAFEYMNLFPKSKGRVFITGSSKMSFNEKNAERKNPLLIIDQQFFSQEAERKFAYETLVSDLNRENMDFRVYLRMNHNRNYLKKLTDGRIIEWKRGSIKNNISESKCVLGFTSTALLESLYSYTPAISYDYLGFNDQIGFFSKVSLSSSSLKEIIKQIRIFTSQDREKSDFKSFIREHISCEGTQAVNLTKETILSKM
ncbi:MAG: hypothetical protein AB7T10_03115 [bacterium]